MARGGYRPGAGRKKGSKTKAGVDKRNSDGIPPGVKDAAKAENLDPLTYMLKVMNDPTADSERRDRLAIAAAPFVHARKGEGKGKKDEREEKARAAGSGRFGTGTPPVRVVK
jgi:hypothetical protein